MKHIWNEKELADHFTLSSEELKLITNKSASLRIGFAVLLKYFQYENKFPSKKHEIPKTVIRFISSQINISEKLFDDYKWDGRSIKKHRMKIRDFCGFKKWRQSYSQKLNEKIQESILPQQFKYQKIKDAVLQYLRDIKVEPPKKGALRRIINSAVNNWEEEMFKEISDKISHECKSEMDSIIDNKKKNNTENDGFRLRQLKSDPGNVSLKSILTETDKLECIRKVNLPHELFKDLPYKILKRYRDRVITEPAREIRRHPDNIRYALLSIFLYVRGREITDDLLDLLIQLVHNIGTNAEKTITKEYIREIFKVNNKEELLYKFAVASIENPTQTVEDAIFPAIGEQTIHNIIKEYKQNGEYTYKVNTRMRSSYRSHYRRMLPAILKALDFQSNNQEYRPIIDAIQILRKYIDSRIQFYPEDEDIPIESVVPNAWKDLVFEANGKKKRLNRIAYEICVFGALREKLRCKEIWAEGADRYRNPDEDLPSDFDLKQAEYYNELNLPLDVEKYIANLQKAMDKALKAFNDGYPKNSFVEFIKKNKKYEIKLSSSEAQPDPPNLHRLKSAIKKEWNIINLLDILKEADLRINFTKHFKSVAQREIMDWSTLQKRLILVLYAMGTNAGVKRIVAGDHGEKYHDLMYVLRRFVTKEQLRHAIADVTNAIFEARLPHIWGEATTSCASDSKQFKAWDQNLLTEYHARYGGRGVMIYWHVEKGASCICSQLKKCSSSEAATMIEGVMRHCTEMA
ncbi:MAG: Tn3 family transposase, partial [Thermotogota bacterium]|nr:Tn3 family transposase [Thermotogota bacterium]